MTLAFVLYKYFPYGGLQRDFVRIAQACQRRGNRIRVYTQSWQGEMPDGFELVRVPARALGNHVRNEKFARWVQAHLAANPVDRIIGFNKMPGLDVYYAADPCYEDKARNLRNPLYRYSPRYRHFSAFERAVFAPELATQILMIAERQVPIFQQHYGTPTERFHMLPPGILPDRRAPPDAPAIRAGLRAEFGLGDDDLLLTQIGSGFKTKGLDRSLRALAALPPELRTRTRFIVIGQDDPAPFLRLAASLGITDRVQILPGRDDVPRFLLGADLLLHPAYNENTGTVLLEGVVAGLPVLTTAACGYAHFITEAGAGEVIHDPFEQAALNAALRDLLTDESRRAACAAAGLRFAEHADIYSLHQRAADVITSGLARVRV
jgi:UDP-glucose:(heptosyl)LPS alpha-1,3-glucosyltransferase